MLTGAMASIIEDSEITLEPLVGSKIGMIGYGSQGRAQALNARDSGLSVKVCLRDTSPTRKLALDDGFEMLSANEIADWAELMVLAVPDMDLQQAVPANLSPGQALIFLHGFALHYDLVKPPDFVDVILVSPAGPGPGLREQFQKGSGFASLHAVAQDATGNAKQIGLAYAKAIGCTAAGVIESTIAEETETDLFGEQVVLCGGMPELIKAAFNTLVQAGYQPEVAYFECVHQVKLITDLIYRDGISGMREAISGTAEWGSYISGRKVIPEQSRHAMKQVLNDIQSGSFAESWKSEFAAGSKQLLSKRDAEKNDLIESVGFELRKRMPFLKQ